MYRLGCLSDPFRRDASLFDFLFDRNVIKDRSNPSWTVCATVGGAGHNWQAIPVSQVYGLCEVAVPEGAAHTPVIGRMDYRRILAPSRKPKTVGVDALLRHRPFSPCV